MGDENPIRTLGDYSKPSHEGYMNTIELLVGNNMVPLRSDTIQLVQNGCSFHRLRSMDSFQGLTEKFHHYGIGRWLQIQNFYDHVSFHFMCEIERVVGGKLRDKNADKSSKIIKNLALYDHEGWKDTGEFIKLVKAISIPQSTSKTPDRRLLELEDQVNCLLKGSRPTPRLSSTHIPQAYAEAVYSNTRTIFEAQVRDYMAAHTKRIKRFENAIFKQLEEINDRMTEMFGLLKELTTSRAPEKLLIREEAKFPITKNVNSISLTRGEEERSEKTDVTTDDDFEKPTKTNRNASQEAEKDDERIAKDILVKVAEHVYPVDFVILDIKEDEKRPFILGRKAYLIEDKQILSVGVFSTWMAFRRNTCDLGSFGEETDEITDLHQILEEILLTERGDGVTSRKRRRRDLFSDNVWNLETVSGRGRLKEDLQSST
nr:MAK10-like protein [Tanacetum cinerariifolium]